MEFPSTGSRCTIKECRRLDFLPVNCSFCSNMFCKEHFNVISHSCLKFTNNTVFETVKSPIFLCSKDLCSDKSLIKIVCSKCNKYFCISHRIHGCFDNNQVMYFNKLTKLEKSSHNFLEAKTVVDQEIINKLSKSKKTDIVNKVQLMRLKGQSMGLNNIPITERRYFLVYLPINGSMKFFGNSKGCFVCINWNIGKVIDSIANILNIPNYNNTINPQKLRLYQYTTGNIITNKMDMNLVELLNTNILINGQSVIIEYSNSDKIDILRYK